MLQERKAPANKFIVGEADLSEGEWGQVGEPYDTVEAAIEAAEKLDKNKKAPQLAYYLYDEHGIMPSAKEAI